MCIGPQIADGDDRLVTDGTHVCFAVNDPHLWEAGNSTHLFRRFSPATGSCALVMAPISDLSAERTPPMSYSRSCSGRLMADEASVLANAFAVLGQRLVFLSTRAPRLLRKELSAMP